MKFKDLPTLLNHLGVNSLDSITPEKSKALFDVSSYIDKDLLLGILQYAPVLADFVKYYMDNTKEVHLAAIASNDKSLAASSERTLRILESFAKNLEKDNLSPEEREMFANKMIEVHDKQSNSEVAIRESTKEIVEKNNNVNEKVLGILITVALVFLNRKNLF